MAEIKLFIATTLDGFIARENGSLDWLPGSGDTGQDLPDQEKQLPESKMDDGGYSKFLAGIDVIIIGRKTYEEILGFGIEWPYGDFQTYIVTSDANYKTKTDNTFTINELNKKVIDKIKMVSQKSIWLMGGGQLITQFLNYNSIDEMTLTLISIILGQGIRLFPGEPKETKFQLIKTESFASGMVNLTYRKK